MRVGSGIAPILKYRQAGINVTFGCDRASSNDSQDLLEAIKIGSILHNVTDSDYQHWITPRQAVEMASLGGANGILYAYRDDLGTAYSFIHTKQRDISQAIGSIRNMAGHSMEAKSMERWELSLTAAIGKILTTIS